MVSVIVLADAQSARKRGKKTPCIIDLLLRYIYISLLKLVIKNASFSKILSNLLLNCGSGLLYLACEYYNDLRRAS